MDTNLPKDEEGRLSALHRSGVGAGHADAMLDRIAGIAAASLGTPMAAVSIVDRDRQITRAAAGFSPAPVPRTASFCAQAILSPHPLAVRDAAEDPRWSENPLVLGEPRVRAYLGAPLVSPDGYGLGTVCVMDTVPRSFSEDRIRLLADLARLAMDGIAAIEARDRDPLTGAATRRAFQTEVEREFARATRYERPAALIFLDIDRFRTINASFGQTAGDEALRAIANRCMEQTREPDSFGRLAGGEFAFLLPETVTHEAVQCAERMRETVSQLRFRNEKGVMQVTASFGVAALGSDISSAAQWFAEADVALYAAKRAGRDCVVLTAPDRRPKVPATTEAAEHISSTSLKIH